LFISRNSGFNKPNFEAICCEPNWENGLGSKNGTKQAIQTDTVTFLSSVNNSRVNLDVIIENITVE
jgi:hypothetical protein